MSFQTHYSIPEDVIRKLEFISKADGHLQILRMNPDWASLLESRARILEAIGSIGIEGTVVSIDQARALTTKDRTVQIGEKEQREFEGYYESLDFIRNSVAEPLSVTLLLRLHELVTRGDAAALPGKLRNDIRVIKSKGKVIFTPPSPEYVPVLLREFITWFNEVAEDKSISPIIAGAICHFWFVWIHPFCDGNGRTGRLLTTFLLMKKKAEGIRYFALSDYYNTNKDTYYDALEETNICDPNKPAMNFHRDLTQWVVYFIESYREQMQQLEEITNRILQLNIRVAHLRKTGKITDSHDKVLSFLSSREKASYSELIDHLGVSKQRVHQILEPLRNANILVEEDIGKTKWFKLGSPEEIPDETVLTNRNVKKKLDQEPVDSEKPISEAIPVQRVLPIFENMS